jgi:hypothetical protein
MRKVELRPLESNEPGQGQLVIIGWQGTGEGLSVDIQRNQDDYFLQDNGQWGSNPFKFHLPALQPSADGNLAAVVDSQIVDPLLENPRVTNMARFYGPEGAEVGRTRLRLAQGLMPSGASGSTPELDASATLVTHQPPSATSEPHPTPEPQPTPEPPPAPEPAKEPVPEPESTPEPPAPAGKSKRWLWILLSVVILAALLGAAAWFGMSMRDQAEPPLVDEPATAIGPCSLQRMGEMSELEFIQACTGAGSEAGNLLDVVNEALANDHCGIARRLYAHQALNGDIAAALAYAREFDPAQHAPSACFPEPDAETASFWYETALGLDPDNAEARQRLEVLQ